MVRYRRWIGGQLVPSDVEIGEDDKVFKCDPSTSSRILSFTIIGLNMTLPNI
ncbi:hypothetical protein LguiA_035192 [Lonicera macranthoides]